MQRINNGGDFSRELRGTGHPTSSMELDAQEIKYIRTLGSSTQRKPEASSDFEAKWANRQIHRLIFGLDEQIVKDILAVFQKSKDVCSDSTKTFYA